jgi:hypothetical protein
MELERMVGRKEREEEWPIQEGGESKAGRDC